MIDAFGLTLRDAAEQALAQHLYSDAIFLAERWVAHAPCAESIYMLGLSLYRSGSCRRAIDIMRDAQRTEDIRYLLAVCYYQTGQLEAAESALICRRGGRTKFAVQHLRKALELNPFLFSAYEALCELGVDVDPSDIYGAAALSAVMGLTASAGGPTGAMGSIAPGTAPPLGRLLDSGMQTPSIVTPAGVTPSVPAAAAASTVHESVGATPVPLPFVQPTPVLNRVSVASAATAALNATPAVAVVSTPTPVALDERSPALATPTGAPPSVPAAPRRRDPRASTKVRRKRGRILIADEPSRGPAPRPIAPPSAFPVSGPASAATGRGSTPATPAPVRRSTRLFAGQPATGRSAVAATPVGTGAPEAGTALIPDVPPAPLTDTPAVEDDGSVASLLAVLRVLAAAYRALSLFQGHDAVDLCRQLPLRHQQSPYVQCLIGRAYFEMADYKNAEAAYEAALQKDPTRAAGMAHYSTVLWHLKRASKLAILSQTLCESEPLSPETWCVAGNCLSLNFDHENAVRMFERAIRVDAYFVYAYTLLGHEHISSEEYDRAATAFRYALGRNDRHYNSWYGLGMICYNQEKFQQAEYYFRRAVGINTQNSVLYTYLGMALFATGRHESALESLNRALALDPPNPLARFKRANVLLALNEDDEALAELEQLRVLTPREAAIHKLLGRLYKRRGDTARALQHFIIAGDLDPKDLVGVKSAIESVLDRDADVSLDV